MTAFKNIPFAIGLGTANVIPTKIQKKTPDQLDWGLQTQTCKNTEEVPRLIGLGTADSILYSTINFVSQNFQLHTPVGSTICS